MRVLLEDRRVNPIANQRRSCIHIAIKNGFVDVVVVLLARFALTNAHTTVLIGVCVEHGRSEILKVILQYLCQS